jgi:hypothetical protein
MVLTMTRMNTTYRTTYLAILSDSYKGLTHFINMEVYCKLFLLSLKKKRFLEERLDAKGSPLGC